VPSLFESVVGIDDEAVDGCAAGGGLLGHETDRNQAKNQN